MIPRALRADPRQISASRPVTLRLPWGIARFVPAEGAGGFAVIVPKKAAKLSVIRHLAKRRVSAAFLAVRPEGFLVSITLSAAGAAARGAQLRTWCAELRERILEPTHD